MIYDKEHGMVAPPGTIWVCSACGKTAFHKRDYDDVSCMTHSVLCYLIKTSDTWTAVQPEGGE